MKAPGAITSSCVLVGCVVALAGLGGLGSAGPGSGSSELNCLQCHGPGWPAADKVRQVTRVGHQEPPLTLKQPGGGASDVVLIGQLARYYSPVVFDHRIHAQMSEINGGCVNCHHHAPSEAPIAACRTCHSIEREAGTLARPSLKGAYHRQCLGCHRDWSHDNGCGYCHVEQAPRSDVAHPTDASDIVLSAHPRIEPARTYVYQTANRPAPLVSFHHQDHTSLFQVRCVSCHQGGSCASCHDGAVTTHDQAGHMSSCRTCHATSQCGFCHSVESRPEFDHADRTGWSLQPQHESVACTSCHGRAESFFTPTRNCRGCHSGLTPGSFDHAITGVPLRGSHASFACERCHVDSRSDRPATCRGCHAERAYPQVYPGQAL